MRQTRKRGDPVEHEWDLFRRGQLDQDRHLKRLREAIKDKLADLVITGEIMDGGKVRIPIKQLREYRFRFAPDEEDGTGSVSDQDGGRPRKGDKIGKRQQQGDGNGPGDGGGGEGFYEAEIGVEQVADVVFADLELPRIQRKIASKAYTEELKMEDIRKKGPMANLDKKLTVLNNIRRNAAKGDPHFGELADDDLRFRTADMRRVPQDQVAVIFVRDSSGSMGEREKLLTRALSFWITRFLQFKYKKVVETAFILHHTDAREVSEDDYFHLGESGGTRVSSGFELALKIINERFSPENYNNYVFAFSDGDNLSSDNPRVVAVAKELLKVTNLVGYTDILPAEGVPRHYSAHPDQSTVRVALDDIGHPYLVTVAMRSPEDALKVLRAFFGRWGKEEESA